MLATIRIEARPYRLRNHIMDYDWGSRDADALIPQLLGLTPEPGRRYAELWMGAHPKAPSQIQVDGELVPLDQVIEAQPDAVLGPDVAARFGGTLPFLFKVLSAGEALSIQAHPNQAQAAELHARDPQDYPDANHKPEVAIALRPTRALAGFRPLAEMALLVESCPELAGLLGATPVRGLRETIGESIAAQADAVRAFFASLLEASGSRPDDMARALALVQARLVRSLRPSREESLFLALHAQRGQADVGLFAPFFLNLLDLAPGQGLFVKPGLPHAYLGGDVVECMANSDNVVRLGLTNKFRDVEALAEILDYAPGRPAILEGEGEPCAMYSTPAAEFRVSRCHLEPGEQLSQTGGRPSIMIVMHGALTLRWADGEEEYSRGDSMLLPARLQSYDVSAKGAAELFVATVP